VSAPDEKGGEVRPRMKARHVRVLLVLAAFLSGAVLCFAVFLLLNEPAANRPMVAAIGGPFRLIDQNGRTVTDRDQMGHPFLVFFGFTHCPEVCPTTLFDISEVLRKLGPDADRTRALFITVDPERDTPQALKDYLSSFDPHIEALTGDADAIAAVAKAYRAIYRKVPLDNGDYTMDHTAIVYLMDKKGRFVSPFKLKRTTEEAADELRKHL
jgi:protein SCO1/2